MNIFKLFNGKPLKRIHVSNATYKYSGNASNRRKMARKATRLEANKTLVLTNGENSVKVIL